MHIYERLNVRNVINAFETVTSYGGSLLNPKALEAMIQASEYNVYLDELQEKVGNRIAEITNNEAALVTSGVAAGLALAIAACMTKYNKSAKYKLPETDTIHRNEVIVLRCQFSPFISAPLCQMGAKIVEVGNVFNTPEEEFSMSITNSTAAVCYSTGILFERYALPLETVVKIAHASGVPVIVDAAAQLPPSNNLWRYTQMGADLALFSGGKALCGPQNSGLAVGNEGIIQLMRDFSCPHQGIGRQMKITKEDIVGLFVAIEQFIKRDQEDWYNQLMNRAKKISKKLNKFSGIKSWILPTGRHGQKYPRVVAQLLPELKMARSELMKRLKNGKPAIEVGELDEDVNAIYVNPMGLKVSEEIILLNRIGEIIEEIK